MPAAGEPVRERRRRPLVWGGLWVSEHKLADRRDRRCLGTVDACRPDRPVDGQFVTIVMVDQILRPDPSVLAVTLLPITLEKATIRNLTTPMHQVLCKTVKPGSPKPLRRRRQNSCFSPRAEREICFVTGGTITRRLVCRSRLGRGVDQRYHARLPRPLFRPPKGLRWTSCGAVDGPDLGRGAGFAIQMRPRAIAARCSEAVI